MAHPNGHSNHTPLKDIQQESEPRVDASPGRLKLDSPSRQLLLELARRNDDYVRQLQNRLDLEASERESELKAALAAAAAEHERVRESAEREHELESLEYERQRRAREDEEKRALERARRELAERELEGQWRELEEARLLEERQRQLAETQRQVEEERRCAAKRRDEEVAERLRREEEDSAKQAKERADRAEQGQHSKSEPVNNVSPITASTAATPATDPDANSRSAIATATAFGTDNHEDSHRKYLALHKRLKEMRKTTVAQSKQDPRLKTRLGDMKREIRKSVGQLTEDNQGNRVQIDKIISVLKEGQAYAQPATDVRLFFANEVPSGVNADDNQVPTTLIYLLNIFAKAIIKQLTEEAGVAPKAANSLGILAITTFSTPQFRWQGVSLVDILITKFHVHCPVLFGIYGSEKTESGRRRVGWARDPETGSWASEQDHANRMTGLGAGYAALTLRDFKNAKRTNPYPPQYYWRAMACIVNVPAKDITQTHMIVLKAMIEHSVPRFVGFFGKAAVAALRKAVIEIPEKAERSVASSALSTLQKTIQRHDHITL